MSSLLLPLLHVSILFGFLYFMMRTPFVQYMAERYREVADGLNQSKIQVADAEAKRKEIEKKLSSLGQSRDLIFQEWREREQLQLQAIKDGSKRALSQLEKDATSNRSALAEQAKKSLVSEIGLVVLKMAQNKISEKLSGGAGAEAHQKINDRFSREVGDST